MKHITRLFHEIMLIESILDFWISTFIMRWSCWAELRVPTFSSRTLASQLKGNEQFSKREAYSQWIYNSIFSHKAIFIIWHKYYIELNDSKTTLNWPVHTSSQDRGLMYFKFGLFLRNRGWFFLKYYCPLCQMESTQRNNSFLIWRLIFKSALVFKKVNWRSRRLSHW